MRLDKFLAHTMGYSRTDVKKFLKQKEIELNGKIVTSASIKIDPENDVVTAFSEPLNYQEFVYLIMNKPSGYLSATRDGKQATVIDLIDEYYDRFELSIAGRLDKDTEGLLLLTNDGQFLHDIISPKRKVYKTYIAQITGELTKEKVAKLETGVKIYDGKNQLYKTAPAKVRKLSDDWVEIKICEGKFHQVKRMFKSVDCHVIFLKRTAIGNLILDEKLSLGEYRELESEELIFTS